MTVTPFADDATSVSIGKLTVENGMDRVAIYGSLNITRDRQGLAHARALLAILQGRCSCWRGRRDCQLRCLLRQAQDGGQPV